MGMGSVDFGGPFSNALKQASVTVMPNAQCIETFPELTKNDMCTTPYQKDRSDGCQGDSGGPVIQLLYNRHFVIGTIKEGIYVTLSVNTLDMTAPGWCYNFTRVCINMVTIFWCSMAEGIYCGTDYPGKCQRVSPYRDFIQKYAGPLNYFCLYNH